MIPLPNEIWLNIALYVPPDHLRNLFSVNQTFFHMAMDERYGMVHLGHWDTKTVRLLERLQDDYVAKRVRSLSITDWAMPHNLHTAPLPSSRTVEAVEAGLLDVAGLDLEWSDPVGHITRTIRRTVSKMSNVTEYTSVHLRMPGMVNVHPPFAFNTLPFSQYLRKLNLTVVSSNIAKLYDFNLSTAYLPSLQILIIAMQGGSVSRRSYRTEPALLMTIAQFIFHCRFTLKELAITTNFDLDSSSFFDSLGFLPGLTRISLRTGICVHRGQGESAITSFVRKHAETLRIFGFAPSNTCRNSEDVDRGLQRIQKIISFSLPHLQRLELDFGAYCRPSESLVACIRPFADSLTALNLRNQTLNFRQLKALLELFSQKLKSAWLQVECLSPRTVAFFVKRLCALEDLGLSFLNISDDSWETAPLAARAFREELFCQAMNQHSYPNCLLRNVTLQLHFCCGRVLCWRAMKALAKSIPSITSFNNQGDMLVEEGRVDGDLNEEILDACICPHV